MTHASWIRAARGTTLAILALTVASCTMKKQEAPALTGPSEFAQSIVVEVSPDVLAQDGASQSIITITARGPNGEPLRNVSVRAEIHVGGTPVDFGSLSARQLVTNADGRATAVYTAPAAPSVAVDTFTIVDIVARPIGNDYNNATLKTAAIRLVPPNIVIPPDGLRPIFTVAPTLPVDSQDVLFDASASEPVGGIVSYSWEFGDGGRGSGRVATHKYSAAGVYHPTLTIADAYGRTASTTRTVTVSGGTNPTAAFVFSPAAPRVGQGVAFNASASAAPPGQHIVSYQWDFGDGVGLRPGGVTINYTFGAAGTFNVTLLVTDNTGKTSSTTRAVTVTP